MLDDFNELLAVLKKQEPMEGRRPAFYAKLGKMYCPVCAENTYMDVTCQSFHGVADCLLKNRPLNKETAPTIFDYRCINCDLRFSAMLYMGARVPAFCLFPNNSQGLSTPHTPELVAFYLRQAYLSQTAGAMAAALVMYRAALHFLLKEQGFNGTIYSQLNQLKTQKDIGLGPVWVLNINQEIFSAIKYLGDIHMHALLTESRFAQPWFLLIQKLL